MTDETTLEQIQEAKAEAEPVEATPETIPEEELQRIKESEEVETFAKIMEEATELGTKDFGFPKFAESVKKGLVSKKAIEAFSTDWGKKYIDNLVKMAITFPYVVKINQQALVELTMKYATAEEKDKKGIKESIYGTLGQIKTIQSQVDALKGMMTSYEEVLTELNNL